MIKIFVGMTVFLLFVGLVPASAQAIKGDGGTLNIHLLDYCDPASFNAVLGEGACERDITPGFITFNGFIGEVTAEKSPAPGDSALAPPKRVSTISS